LRIHTAAAARPKAVTFEPGGLDLSNFRGTFRPDP
jgi:hypothetical protein